MQAAGLVQLMRYIFVDALHVKVTKQGTYDVVIPGSNDAYSGLSACNLIRYLSRNASLVPGVLFPLIAWSVVLDLHHHSGVRKAM